jgi:hypothetical protein
VIVILVEAAIIIIVRQGFFGRWLTATKDGKDCKC